MRKVETIGHFQRKLLSDDVVLGITSVGSLFCDPVMVVVRLCRVFAAELLLALAALVAVLTRIDDTTDGDSISNLVSLNFASDFDDAAHNLMARHNNACTSTAGRNRLPGSTPKSWWDVTRS